MTTTFQELLPEEMSDEAAYCVVNFLMDLALAMESHYLAKIKRYREETWPPEAPDYLR